MIPERHRNGAAGVPVLLLILVLGIADLYVFIKAAMVSNLLVVLCGEKAAPPIVNTGTIHQ